MPADKKSEALAAWDRWLDRQDILIAKSQRVLELSLDCGLAASLLKDLRKKMMDPRPEPIVAVRRVAELQKHLALIAVPARRLPLSQTIDFSNEWPRDLDVPSCRSWTSEGEAFLIRGNIADAIRCFLRAIVETNRPDSVIYLVDAVGFMQEFERCAGTDDPAARENLISARQSVGRFKMLPAVAAKLGRISLPVFARPAERALYRLFRTFGDLDYEMICEHLKCSKSTAKSLLEGLLDRGVIVKEPTEAGKKAVFHLPR